MPAVPAKEKPKRSARARPAGKPAYGVTPGGLVCLKTSPTPSTRTAWFDAEAADCACEFFAEYLKHSKDLWAGRPFLLEPWQRDLLIRPLFGWKLRTPGCQREEWPRLYRRTYWKLPKGNGKSPLAAGLGLLLAFGDGQPGADVYCFANSDEQADIVHGEARKMVKLSAELSAILQVYSKSIVREETMQGFQRLTSDGAFKDGLNWHGLITDEAHELTDRKLWDTLSNANKLSRQPIHIVITTAGVPGENPLYAEIDQQAADIADGKIEDPRQLVVIFGAPEEADWHDTDVWRACNPNFGVSVTEAYLEDEHRKAVLSPARESVFLRYNLNRDVSQKDGWMSVDLWDRCDKPLVPGDLRGRRCVIGMDLSSRKDLTALVACFQVGDDIAWLPHCFTPEEGIDEKARKDRAPYREWAAAGWLTLVPGRVVRDEFMKAKLEEWSGLFEVACVAFDPWGALQLVEQLEAEGIKCEKVRQGWVTMSPFMKKVEELVLSRLIVHGGIPMMRWCMGNVAVVMDPRENIAPNKRKSRGRIDPIVAGIMGTGVLLSKPDEGPSGYATAPAADFLM
ncbi:MAG: terminase large subunit [Phycisphaerales bacterium]|nr:terminase large subunit [Phycisphaerales bacterium]